MKTENRKSITLENPAVIQTDQLKRAKQLSGDSRSFCTNQQVAHHPLVHSRNFLNVPTRERQWARAVTIFREIDRNRAKRAMQNKTKQNNLISIKPLKIYGVIATQT